MLIREIILHHTASSQDKTTLQNVNNWHKARGFNKSSLGFFVGYHYLILGNGETIQTRRDNEIGCHCIPNEGKVGICLCGNFEEEIPNPEQLTSLKTILERLKKYYNLGDEKIFAHCEKSQTLCCGKNLMKWLNLYRQISLIQKLILKLQKLLKIK